MSDLFTRVRQAPDRRTRTSLPVEEWPQADKACWVAAFREGDIFDEKGAGAHLSSATRVDLANAYGRWLGFLSRQEPLALDLAPAERVTRERVIAFCDHLADTNAPTSIAATLHHVRLALRLIAPEADWWWLLTISKRIQAKAQPRPKRHRQRDIAELDALSVSLMEEALAEAEREGPMDLTSALAYRDGLLLAVATYTLLRRRNLAGLRLSEHLVRVGADFEIRCGSHETKGKQALQRPLPPELTRYVEIYLERVRPVFPGADEHVGLWPSAKGCPMVPGAVYDAICRRTKAAFGEAMNPHLFRDAAATSLAVHAPEQVRAAADLLGHKSFGTTEKHYIQAQATSAARLLAAALRKRKDGE